MPKKEVFIPLTYDKLFVSIFGNEEYVDILEVLLEDIFEYPRGYLKGKVALKHRDLPTFNKNHAKKQVDIVVEVNGDYINLELNNKYNKGIEKRNLVYLSAIHGTQLEKMSNSYKSYNNIGNSTQININRGHNLRYTIEPYLLLNTKNIDSVESRIDNIKILMIDLLKGKKYNMSRIDKWCTLLLSKSHKEFLEGLEEIEMEKELKDKIKERVEAFNKDEDEIAIYSDYTRGELEYNTGIEDAKEEGIIEGLKEGKQETAKNFLKLGIKPEIIAKGTGLSLNEIEMLR